MPNEQPRNSKPRYDSVSGQLSSSESEKTDEAQGRLDRNSTERLFGVTKDGIPIIDETGDPNAVAWQPHRSIRPSDCK